MLEVEPYLVELIIKLADMRTPITTSQGLQLANSLIKGTSVEEKVIEWKKKYCKSFQLGAGKPELGREYWQQFMKRNEHLIRSKRLLNLMSNVPNGVTIAICWRCARKFTKTSAQQGLPVNTQSPYGGMKKEK